ncbi:transposase [Pseudovibrio sp. Tun.PSC04-5.I4]|uniref:transposase n=1 Tax=Pseudovibrio sp. Tun.PSC04-5.I4 TaxID=1798213 RepID=UPI00117A646C|nr:transposase [Pseudovibrio sp. Tun.PSC04-5.I4]
MRQPQGFVRSVFHVMELALPVPDFSTLSRDSGGLKLSSPKPQAKPEPTTLVIDSTGIKILGGLENGSKPSMEAA